MADMINSLYNLTLVLLRGCIVTVLITGVYIIGIVKYERKYILLTQELDKKKVDDITYKSKF
ncbi:MULTISPECIES: hypothetical protein [unclassified Clostridium]|uniref:hypothetical protein n=1 Tax=unclassified Clostridium TaxID=2614128 RepID=UPI00023AF9C1|nr:MULTISPECIES: hypothetical protein [unclassified Clostridium]EHI98742.1 hypothetical protein CDLVIII_2067 [Clostridium sp. DL-VIII]OOM74973.1 hypothetical protein CLOBL_41230 [Clostridium sp. BL-8]